MYSPTFLEYLGGLITRWRGANRTRVYAGNKETEFHRLHAKLLDDDFYITITSQRIVYLTTYRRWWVRNRYRIVYEVVCAAPPNVMKRLDPIFFKPKTYPLLCSHFLAKTTYPHIYAINTFLEEALRAGIINSIDNSKSIHV